MKTKHCLQTVLLGVYAVIIMSGCAYHKQKSALERQREYIQESIAEERKKQIKLNIRNKDYKNTKRELMKEIAEMQKNKKSLQVTLTQLQIELGRENKQQEVECGEKCQEVKMLKNKIKAFEQSIEKKQSALSVM